jgi:hypothetical protein
MEKKNLCIIAAVVIAIAVISIYAYEFSHFSSLGSKYRSELADVMNDVSESYRGQLDIANAYRKGEISCEEVNRRMMEFQGAQSEESNGDVVGCYGLVAVIPLFERFLSDAGTTLESMKEEEAEMSDFEMGVMLSSGRIPESMTSVGFSLIRATHAGGTYAGVLEKIYGDELIFTTDNVTVESNESGLEELSACLLGAAEGGVSLVSVECTGIPEDYDVSESFYIFGFDIGVDTENQIYRDSYIKMHQDMLDSVISKLDALSNAEGLHNSGKYMESIVESSLVLSDVFFAEYIGCGTMKTREQFGACVNVTIS